MSAFIAFAFRSFTSSCWPTFSSPDLLCKTPHPSFLIPGMIHRLSFLTIFKTFWCLHHLLELTITCFDSRWIRWRRLLVQWTESRPTVASQLIFEFFFSRFPEDAVVVYVGQNPQNLERFDRVASEPTPFLRVRFWVIQPSYARHSIFHPTILVTGR